MRENIKTTKSVGVYLLALESMNEKLSRKAKVASEKKEKKRENVQGALNGEHIHSACVCKRLLYTF